MKITATNEKNFIEVICGQAFIDKDGIVAMKIDEVFDTHLGCINAVAVTDGAVLGYAPSDMVTVITAELKY